MLLLHLHRWNRMITISRGKSQKADSLLGDLLQEGSWRVCAKGAACKYVKCFRAATGGREAKLGVKVYFDVCASRGPWESPRARGGGVPRGISRGCSNWIFLFMIPASPLWIRGAAVQQTNAVSQGNQEKGGIHYTVQTREKYQLLGALYVIQWWKTWGWERRLRGHYEDYKENPAPVLGAAGKIKKNNKKRKTLMQICRLRDLIQLCLRNKRGGRRTYREWT